MLRCRWLVAIPVLAILLLSACSRQSTVPSTATKAAPAVSSWPITVQDDENRTISLPAEPRRIVSLAPSNTEILFALGLGERVVGLDAFSDYPDAAKATPRVGDLMNPNHEMMLGLKPDLVLAIGGSQKFWERAAAQGIPVVVLQPKTVTDVAASIERIGQVTGATAAAGRLAAEMRTRLEQVRRQVSTATQRPRVFYEVWHEPLMSAGPGSFVHDLITLAGGENVVNDARIPWPEVTLEAMLAANPDVILSGDPQWAGQLQSGAAKQWQQTAAVRNGRVRALDPNLTTRPGPRMIEGLEQVAAALHPDLRFGKNP